jgi:hypothetical protein
MTKRPLESSLQRKIIRSAESEFRGDIIAWKAEKSSIDGVPDLYFAIVGIGSVHIEVKRDKDSKPRPSQVFVINKLKKAGVRTYVIDTWEDWVVLLKELHVIRGD